jgi:hypothetical protein
MPATGTTSKHIAHNEASIDPWRHSHVLLAGIRQEFLDAPRRHGGATAFHPNLPESGHRIGTFL